MNSLFCFGLKSVLYIFFKLFYKLKVIGSENIPVKGGVIVAANHVSYLDPPVIGVALKRHPVYIAKEDLFKIPLLGKFISLFSIAVNRNKPRLSTVKEAVTRLKKGELIVIFPEGARSTDSNLLDAKRGVGIIAALSKAPVVPTLIEGTEKALPRGAKFPRLARISVTFGNPIRSDAKEKGRQFHEWISKKIMEAIKNLRRNENNCS